MAHEIQIGMTPIYRLLWQVFGQRDEVFPKTCSMGVECFSFIFVHVGAMAQTGVIERSESYSIERKNGPSTCERSKVRHPGLAHGEEEILQEHGKALGGSSHSWESGEEDLPSSRLCVEPYGFKDLFFHLDPSGRYILYRTVLHVERQPSVVIPRRLRSDGCS